jgi:hypothetical protein
VCPDFPAITDHSIRSLKIIWLIWAANCIISVIIKLGQLVKEVDFKTLPSTVTHIFQQEIVKRNPEMLKSTPSSRLYSDYPYLSPMINYISILTYTETHPISLVERHARNKQDKTNLP